MSAEMNIEQQVCSLQVTSMRDNTQKAARRCVRSLRVLVRHAVRPRAY
jgi:hypothetical protein